MKKLLLLRHADANGPPISGDDHERPLSVQGVSEAQNLGKTLKNKALLPDCVYCSSAARTSETLEHLIAEFANSPDHNIDLRHDRKFYLAAGTAMLDDIQMSENGDTLMFVGHNPGISELALYLAGDEYLSQLSHYSSATLTVFECDIESWAELTPQSANLSEIIKPD